MIIIEGTDCVGKTWLAKELVKRLNGDSSLSTKRRNWHYSHLSSLSDNWDYYWDYARLIDGFTIMDRFYLSELAYRTVKTDRERRIHPHVVNLIEARLLLVGATTVIITAQEGLIRKLHEQMRFREMFTADQSVEVNAWFQQYLHRRHGITHMLREEKTHYVIELENCRSRIIHWHGTQGNQFPSSDTELVNLILHGYLECQDGLCHLNERKP